jgi:tellurite resistance protein
MTAVSTQRRRSAASRIPLNTLAIAFGIAGLAGLWSIASTALGLSEVLPEVIWAGAAVAWVWLIVAHAIRGSRSRETLISQLRHPAQGPIAAIVPAVGMLLGANLHQFWPLGGTVLVLVSLVFAAVFAGAILAFWHTGRLTPEAFHGAYLLPTVAAALIAATTTFKVGFPQLATGAFAVGIFFWVVIVTVLLARLALFPPLPDALTPTLAILLAPPAVAGTAWFAMTGVKEDAVSTGLLGLLILMLLLQMFLIPVYRKLTFTLGFWSFTFPLAAAGGYAIQWLEASGFPGWQAVAATVAALVSAVIIWIGVRSLLLVSTVRRGARRAEWTLRHADEEVSRQARIAPTK